MIKPELLRVYERFLLMKNAAASADTNAPSPAEHPPLEEVIPIISPLVDGVDVVIDGS